jgi:flagellar motor switch protein FliM
VAKLPLTPSEIELLLTGAPGDEAAVAPAESAAPSPPPAQPADCPVTPEERRVLQALRRLLERFCQGLMTSLSQLLRAETRVAVAGVERALAGQFVWRRADPTCFVTLATADGQPSLLLDIGLPLLFPMLERMLGGGLPPSATIRRPLTEIEQRLAARVAQLVADELRQAADADHCPRLMIRQLASRAEVEPRGADEPVVCVALDVAFGAASGPLCLAVPWQRAEWLRAALTAAAGSASSGAVTPGTGVELAAVLAETRLSSRDVRDLAVGDVIATDKNISEPIDVTLDGQPTFHGTPGTLDGRKAVRLQE